MTLKKISVKFWSQRASLCEAYQSVVMKYAFLSPKADGRRQCHPWIKCRDFLHDALRNFSTGDNGVIYGFTYTKGKNPPLNLKKMSLLVKYEYPADKTKSSREIRSIMDSALGIIHCVEKYAGIKPITVLYQTAKDADIYVFRGSKEWMDSTFMISLYTFLIRLGGKKLKVANKDTLYEELKKIESTGSDNDARYLKTVLPYLFRIVDNRAKLKYKKGQKYFFQDQTIGTFHAYSGIVAICRQAANNHIDTRLAELQDLAKHIRDPKGEVEQPKKMQAME